MSTFCAEHEISRKTFYVLRARAVAEGPAAVLEPRSRRPMSSPSRIPGDVIQQALDVRASLERSGLDHGPISVHDKMRAMGLVAVSTATLSRIFRDAGVARVEPKKKPRAAYRRFVYPQPNACWQLDATEYVLTGGRKCVIFQLIDDHARLAVASHVAHGETSDAAIAVVAKGITAHGVPQRLLTDNGAALNPTRRGFQGQLVDYVTRLGVEAITGKPYKPTTQGKNERFHQTLFRYLDKQPIADSLAELQAQVDEFDRIYNTERPHQSLPGRVTPQQAWDATPVAEPPRPRPQPSTPTLSDASSATGEKTCRVIARGLISVLGTHLMLGKAHAGTVVHATWDHTHIHVFDEQGTQITAFARPLPGTRYIGNGQPRGFMGNQNPTPEASPMS